MAVWQGIGRAGALNGALVMSLAITMLGPRGAAIAADEDVLRTAIEERGWFGLPDGPDHVRELLARDLPPLEGWPGLVVTHEEVLALDLTARMRFVADVDVQLGDLLTSDPTIGDVWFDQALGGRLVVSLTNADSRVRQAIRDLMPANSLGLEFRDADYGLAKLAAAARRFDAAWTDTTGLLPPVSIAVGQGRVGIDGGMGAIVERIYGESWPYGILPQVGTWEGQPLCASLAVTDYTTASDGIKCGIVRNVVSYWQSESGPWRVHGASMDLSGSSGPISGDSGSPIYMRYDSDSGNRRIPVGVVDHEFIPCGPMTPGETYVHTNDCGRDLYFAEVNEVMAEWPTWSIWTGS